MVLLSLTIIALFNRAFGKPSKKELKKISKSEVRMANNIYISFDSFISFIILNSYFGWL